VRDDSGVNVAPYYREGLGAHVVPAPLVYDAARARFVGRYTLTKVM
jgi:hypothetical protein